jgi:hypothetical protein
VDAVVDGAGGELGGLGGDAGGVIELGAAEVNEGGERRHALLADMAGAIAGGEGLDDHDAGAGAVLDEEVAEDEGDRAESIGPERLGGECGQGAAQELVGALGDGGAKSVLGVGEVAVEGGAVEAGGFADKELGEMGVAALGGEAGDGGEDCEAVKSETCAIRSWRK